MRRVIDALERDPAAADRRAAADERSRRDAWQWWAEEPIRPDLSIQYGRHWLPARCHPAPADLTDARQIEAWAAVGGP